MTIARSLFLLTIGVLVPAGLFAQSTAEIRGIVQDESAAIVPFATVTVINELTGLKRTTVSGSALTVETVGGAISEIVDERRIRELPLNGKDPLQLQLLLPGVVPGQDSE